MFLSPCGSQESFFGRVLRFVTPPPPHLPPFAAGCWDQLPGVQPGPPWAALDLATSQRIGLFQETQKLLLGWGEALKKPQTMLKCIFQRNTWEDSRSAFSLRMQGWGHDWGVETGRAPLYLVSSITSSINFSHSSANWFAGILPWIPDFTASMFDCWRIKKEERQLVTLPLHPRKRYF